MLNNSALNSTTNENSTNSNPFLEDLLEQQQFLDEGKEIIKTLRQENENLRKSLEQSQKRTQLNYDNKVDFSSTRGNFLPQISKRYDNFYNDTQENQLLFGLGNMRENSSNHRQDHGRQNSNNQRPIYDIHWPKDLKFSGSNDPKGIKKFLNDLELFVSLNDITDEVVFANAYNFLVEQARTWFAGRRGLENSWDELKQSLLERYYDREASERLKFEIESRKQETMETFPDYYDYMIFLLSCTDEEEYSESRKLKIIREGMLPTLRLQLSSVISNIQTLEQLRVLASSVDQERRVCELFEKRNRHFDSQVLGNREKIINQSNYENNQNQRNSWNYENTNFRSNYNNNYQNNTYQNTKPIKYDQRDNNYRNARNFSNTRNQDFTSKRQENFKCWNCHNSGHGFKDCREIKNIFCHLCGKPGVTLRECCSKNGFNQGLGNLGE